MSTRLKSLGSVASAARGILITGGTNATPIVATVTAGHRQRNGSRIAIAGVTTLTSMNGEFTLRAVGAAAATLDGSAGNGAFGGTAVVAAICDQTPFLPNNPAVASVRDLGGAALFSGTCVFEGADSLDATQFYYTSTAGVATAGFKDVLLSGEIAIPAFGAAGGGSCDVEVQLTRYMTFRCSTYNTGTAQGFVVS
jgi:hypothetical protein